MRSALDLLDAWPVDNVAASIEHGGQRWHAGDTGSVFELASVTKLLSAAAVLVAVEEEAVELDDRLRRLLSHATGERRVYSNDNYDELGRLLEAATDFAFWDYAAEAICAPLAMTKTELRGSPAHGAASTVDDLTAFARALHHPGLLAAETLADMTTSQFADKIGVLPGFGRQTPNPWGLGPEIRGEKSPHWTPEIISPRAYGHFGQSGTFVLVDPDCDLRIVALTDRPFGAWAVDAWPRFIGAAAGECQR